MVDRENGTRLMVDPSVLGSATGLEWFLTVRDIGDLVVPATFVTATQEGLGSRARSFFGLKTLEQPEYQRAWDSATARLASVASFETRQGPLSDEAEEIRESLLRSLNYPLGQILAEEWTFLNTQSWIGSRLLRPFSTFFRHGASFVQVGWRRIAARTLKLPREITNQPLTGIQHTRAVFKWVAAGGADALILMGIPPTPVSALGILANLFVLLDP